MIPADTGDVGSAETTDASSAKTSHVSSAETTDVAAAEAAHMAATKATTTVAAATTATAGLRTGGNEAAGKQRTCQNDHQSSSHEISPFEWADIPPQDLQQKSVRLSETDADVAMVWRW
jgi:hypothetical protein